MSGEEQDCFCSNRVVNAPINCGDLEKLVNFLLRYESLYKHPNIRFLADNQWKVVASEWYTYLNGLRYDDFNRLPFADTETGHLLNKVSDQFVVVGLECNESLSENGKQRYGHINYINLHLNNESAEKIEVLKVFEGNENDRTAIVCLHGCGDLQITLFKLFKKLSREKVPLLFSVPCCYHKLSYLDSPVAEWCLSNALKSCSPNKWTLAPSALRLACQQQICSWSCTQELRQKHTKNFLTRALLECVNDSINIIPTSAPRKLKRSLEDIDNAITVLSKRMNFSTKLTTKLTEAYNDVVERKKQYFQFIEPYTMLQCLMQKPLESLILWDFSHFLVESGFSVSIEIVFNPLISPRNYCIIGSPAQYC
uniref:Methyltranfer_dom domain-containing protein n=1 Tax=Syphacia muris TaxID=451379 RepID=A0A0N5AY53_9BILA